MSVEGVDVEEGVFVFAVCVSRWDRGGRGGGGEKGEGYHRRGAIWIPWYPSSTFWFV